MTDLENTLLFQMSLMGLDPEREYKFHPDRKFRADFAFPDRKLIIEVNGGIWMAKSGHSTGKGIQRDYQKANAAQLLGWTYLQYTAEEIESGTALQEIINFIREK